jgi:hypothetical protein
MAAAAADATRLFALIARMAILLGILAFRVRRPPIAAAMLLLVDFARAIIFAIAAFTAPPVLRERFILRRVRAIIYLEDINNYRTSPKLFYNYISKNEF